MASVPDGPLHSPLPPSLWFSVFHILRNSLRSPGSSLVNSFKFPKIRISLSLTYLFVHSLNKYWLSSQEMPGSIQSFFKIQDNRCYNKMYFHPLAGDPSLLCHFTHLRRNMDSFSWPPRVFLGRSSAGSSVAGKENVSHEGTGTMSGAPADRDWERQHECGENSAERHSRQHTRVLEWKPT